VKAYPSPAPVFDDPNLTGQAGLGPVLALAGRAGLEEALSGLSVPVANPGLKARAVLAGMLAEADSIDDLDALRAGATPRLVKTVRAPSTLGSYLRGFTHGHVRQLGAANTAVLAGLARAVAAAIAVIPETGWIPILYPQAIWDQDQQAWICDAEVAETGFTAFASKPEAQRVNARLVVRCVKRLGPELQDALLPGWRHHPFITNSTLDAVEADQTHRRHAVVEQVIEELKNGPWRTCPPGNTSPTPPGPSSRSSRTTCCAPPRSPPGWSPPARTPSASSSSTSPAAWPSPPAACGCTCPGPGHQNTTGCNSTAWPTNANNPRHPLPTHDTRKDNRTPNPSPDTGPDTHTPAPTPARPMPPQEVTNDIGGSRLNVTRRKWIAAVRMTAHPARHYQDQLGGRRRGGCRRYGRRMKSFGRVLCGVQPEGGD